MQQAIAEVLDHLERYEEQLASLLTERFHLRVCDLNAELAVVIPEKSGYSGLGTPIKSQALSTDPGHDSTNPRELR